MTFPKRAAAVLTVLLLTAGPGLGAEQAPGPLQKLEKKLETSAGHLKRGLHKLFRKEGPVDRTGRKLDRAAKKTGEKVEGVFKENGPLDRTGEKIDRAVGKAADKTQEALEGQP